MQPVLKRNNSLGAPDSSMFRLLVISIRIIIYWIKFPTDLSYVYFMKMTGAVHFYSLPCIF